MIGLEIGAPRLAQGPEVAERARPRPGRRRAAEAGMHTPTRPPAVPAGEELIDGLRQYARARVPRGADAADVETSLLQLQKLATLGQLASEVAHDFGNLMTVM